MTNQPKEERRAILKKQGGRSLLGSALLALLFSLFVGVGALFAAALALSFTTSGTAYTDTVGCVLGALTALLGGIFAGKRQKHTGALAGVLFGALYVLMLLLVARIFGGDASLPKRLIGYAIFLLLSALGGALGGMRMGKRHHGKRRR